VHTAGEHQPPEGAVGYLWLLWGAGTDHCSNLEAYDVARRAGTGTHVPYHVFEHILV
jgi:hypothetical protein